MKKPPKLKAATKRGAESRKGNGTPHGLKTGRGKSPGSPPALKQPPKHKPNRISLPANVDPFDPILVEKCGAQRRLTPLGLIVHMALALRVEGTLDYETVKERVHECVRRHYPEILTEDGHVKTAEETYAEHRDRLATPATDFPAGSDENPIPF